MAIFRAEIEIIGINPYVLLPAEILQALLEKAGKHKGKIPIKGQVNGLPYQQTLVKYAGEWRLYINMAMLKDSPRRIGEEIEISIEYDTSDRSIPMHPALQAALEGDVAALEKFESLSPSRRVEIIRYISRLKTEESVERNVARAIRFLKGEGRFVGRDI
ncbi:MAG: DUF1905 domain-containing protein [Bacteroidetes bacterium]|nr:DUF1905 domain-containing protein [Bacteroidota bacterium]